MKTKPYVVSADVYLLMDKWAQKNNFILPGLEFFGSLRNDFTGYMTDLFPSFELISEETILGHMQQVTSQYRLPTLSLDPVYFSGDFLLELTRSVSSTGQDQGIRSRCGQPAFIDQIRKLKKTGFDTVCLVDDVIFSGTLLKRLLEMLDHLSIKVPIICSGVGIEDGISRVSSSSRKVMCALRYKNVIDEVCERDFYIGVPYSGRSMTGATNIGLPYILPFGNPGKWASIPEKMQEHFSEFCFDQTIRLFEAIEVASNKIIYCSDIDRKVINQPEQKRFVDFVHEFKKQPCLK